MAPPLRIFEHHKETLSPFLLLFSKDQNLIIVAEALRERGERGSTFFMPVTYFAVIGPSDAAVYEYGRLGAGDPGSSAASPAASAAAASAGSSSSSSAPVDTMQLSRQFMLYSALDMVDEAMWTKSDFYLSRIDKFDDRYYVSAYAAFAPIRLLLMQDQEPHDNVRPFFSDAYELCVRHLMSPFVDSSQPIRSREFDERMITIFTRYF